MAKRNDGKRNSVINRPLSFLLLVVISAILFIEFFYDVKRDEMLNRVVSGLDVFLLLIFFAIVLRKLQNNRADIVEFASRYKADVLYLSLIISFSFMPRVAAGLVIVRVILAFLLAGLESRVGTKVLSSIKLRPSQSLALSFIGLIGVGTALMTFPAATVDGKGAAFLDALFTMTSASCVTGLTVFDIGSEFTRFGQAIVFFGMQVGGLGIMVLSAAFAVLVGGTIPSRKQAGLSEVLDVWTPSGLKALIRAVTATTIVMELFGALLLFFLWQDHIPNIKDRLWWAVFHAVSAFCNAGFALSGSSLNLFVGNLSICLVFIALITVGGIGFFVISDLSSSEVWRIKKPRAIWHRLQIQTKVVLVASLVLNGLGMLLFLFFEFDGALHGLSISEKISASLFQSITLRTAGFTVVPMGDLAATTILFSIAFMFVGAAPGSTGGGIKTTTAAISIMALRAMLRGREEVELFNRRVPPSIVNRSLSIVLVAGLVVVVFLTLLLATQDISFEKLFFEAVSAFGTVGLTIDTTGRLNDSGKLLISVLMFIGRIGPLTLALAVGEKKIALGYRLPKGRIAVG